MNEILEKIERIKSIFMDVQLFNSKQNDMHELLKFLENTEIAYRSIAYESASIAIAEQDIQTNNKLNSWHSYAKGPALAHKTQVHVGLGWAIAKLNLPFLSIVENIDPFFYHRIADGCGFYDGSFRQRTSILCQQAPDYIPESFITFYDQGLGRSLWYTQYGDINNIHKKIEYFPACRQAGLWRGIGIAVAYVGGCDEDNLTALLKYAATNGIQLAYGAALAVRSRLEANSMTADTDICFRLWTKLCANEANAYSFNPIDVISDEENYFKWIRKLQEALK